MKKILPLLLLLFVLALSGCNQGSPNTCFFGGLTPYASYLFVFNVGNGAKVYRTATASSTGSVVIPPPIGANCSSVAIVPWFNYNLALSANPSSINLVSPPSTVTITGQSFDTTYGMPRVEYFDGNGFLVGSVIATSVSSGTSLTASVPDLSSAYSGTYQVRITNITSQGYYSNTVGTASLSAYGRDRLDSDDDGWYDDEDCDPYDPSRNTFCGGCPEDPTAIVCD
jgi:hypothetical protein